MAATTQLATTFSGHRPRQQEEQGKRRPHFISIYILLRKINSCQNKKIKQKNPFITKNKVKDKLLR